MNKRFTITKIKARGTWIVFDHETQESSECYTYDAAISERRDMKTRAGVK